MPWRRFKCLACLFGFFGWVMTAAFAHAQIPVLPTQLFQRQADSVVLVAAAHKKKNKGKTGTGFIVREDGLIVTNYHLVNKAKRILVKLKDNHVYSRVEVVRVDPRYDIALLKIKARGLRPVQLGNSDGLKVGERVMAIGHPLGLQNTLSDGLISSWREGEGVKLLQISVPLSSGSSGGPLFNQQGEVVGVTTASLEGGQSLNFAVPINYVKSLVAQSGHAVSPAVKSHHRDLPADAYVVKTNDTLYRLARRFKTSVKEIMALNKLPNSDIHTGQTIRIPR